MYSLIHSYPQVFHPQVSFLALSLLMLLAIASLLSYLLIFLKVASSYFQSLVNSSLASELSENVYLTIISMDRFEFSGKVTQLKS